MAVIEQYISNRKVAVPNAPGSNAVISDQSSAIEAGARAARGPLGAADTLLDTVVKVATQQQTNAANTYATEKLADLRDRASMDPDLKSQGKYLSELDKIGADAADNIDGPLAKDEFKSRYNIAAISAKYAITDSFRTRTHQAAQADLLSNIEALKNSYFNSVYPQEKTAAVVLMKQAIKDNVTAQIISPVEGEKMWQGIAEELPAKTAQRDIGINPMLALQRLKGNTYGINDEGKRSELIASAESAALREQRLGKKNLEQAQEKIAIDLTAKLWDGNLSLEEIHDEMTSGVLPREDAEQLRKAVLSDKTSDIQSKTKEQNAATEIKQAATYMSAWDMILKKGSAIDKRRAILKEFSDGNLRKEDAIKLYTGYLIPNAGGGKVSLAEAVAAEQAAAQKNEFIAGAIQMFRKFWNQQDTSDEGAVE